MKSSKSERLHKQHRARAGTANRTADRFDISEFSVEAFTASEWEMLERLAAGEAEDARWTRCPCCAGKAVLFTDDEMTICLSDAACSQSEIDAAEREDAVAESEDPFDLGSAE